MTSTVLLSNGGASIFRSFFACDRLIVGTVDGIFVLSGNAKEWALTRRALEGISVSSLTQLASGTILAATHGVGVARSTDDGETWDWSNNGLVQFDLWAARSGTVHGRDVALIGAMPSALMLSEDDGVTWRNLPGLHAVPSFAQWYFPPPPRLGHIKEINIFGDRIFVGIEIGALLVSDDCGETFRDMKVDPDPKECDIHRVLINPHDPMKMHAAVGLVGLMRSIDGGETWTRDPIMPGLEYPDAFVLHPDRPETLFLSAGRGWPINWYKRNRAEGRIARSKDGGATWERLLGGLPDGQRSLFSALSLQVHAGGFELFAVDTDGQLFQSRDGGDRWTMIAETAPVSKGEFYRALTKGRPRIASVDDMVVTAAGAARLAALEERSA